MNKVVFVLFVFVVVLLQGTISPPASAHRTYTGPRLSRATKARIVRIVSRLPECRASQPTNCKYAVRGGYDASFIADGDTDRPTYYVETRGGHLTHVEVYR